MIAGAVPKETRAPNRAWRLIPPLAQLVSESARGQAASCAAHRGPRGALRIEVREWLAEDVDLLKFDATVHRLEDACTPFLLLLVGDGGHTESVAAQVLTRYQRLLTWRGAGTLQEVRDVLPAHRALFDMRKPLVRADYDHSLDTWRWILRLSPKASSALQLAALFHDIERLSTEAESRVEHLAPDYQDYKRRHAATGATILARLLTRLELAHDVVQRTCELVRRHEAPHGDTELRLLNDADSLSFFSLNSWGFVNYFGGEHTRVKVHYTLGRMSREALAFLPTFRLHRRVARYIHEYSEDGHE